MGATSRESCPQTTYGSEVFELNNDLKQLAISFARTVSLEVSAAAAKNRALYSHSPGGVYHVATLDPSIVAGDVTAGNVIFHGNLLCEGFEKVVRLYTSGKAEYYMTAQEDMAIMAALPQADFLSITVSILQ
jgi:purine nucleoside permease